eukprot:768399-Hanusia_phi.AAC.4
MFNSYETYFARRDRLPTWRAGLAEQQRGQKRKRRTGRQEEEQIGEQSEKKLNRSGAGNGSELFGGSVFLSYGITTNFYPITVDKQIESSKKIYKNRDKDGNTYWEVWNPHGKFNPRREIQYAKPLVLFVADTLATWVEMKVQEDVRFHEVTPEWRLWLRYAAVMDGDC